MRCRPPLLLALLWACHLDRITTQDPVVAHDAHAWSGGSFQIVSGAFNTADSVRVLLDGKALAVQRLDSITLRATLPDTTGTFGVRFELGDRRYLAGSLTIHGGVQARIVTGNPDGIVVAWPRSAGTFVAGFGHLALIDVSGGSVAAIFQDSLYSSSCSRAGPQTAGAGLIVSGPVPSANNPMCRIRMLDVHLAATDSFPFYSGCCGAPPVVRLADGSWVQTGASGGASTIVYQRNPDGGYTQSSLPFYDVSQMATSADGVYAFAAQGFTTQGWMPILRGGFLQAPPFASGVSNPQAATFSDAGDTLFVQRFAQVPDSLFVIASATGQVLTGVLPSLVYTDLAVDPGRPWLYAASADSAGASVSVVIYDLRTMGVVTTLRAPTGVTTVISPIVVLALDAFHRRLNVFLNGNFRSTAGVALSLDLMP